MDADVMITIAFCVEVFLFGLAAVLFVAHEIRKARLRATANAGTKSRPVASAEESGRRRDTSGRRASVRRAIRGSR
jgi:hypothetical protein